ncbi:hypothetical protein [Parasedimentitalea huanghaiensis]|uniref:Uncharacterized protein n=1 Tax=Parasedimentitalea huanghaiensis TaxID=2682100 RepID=A0A6L6WGI4_9RHOB|nr:hypothetical protein [Zongyanglinia huanghaiensis]MVO14792.1 hypothetical protein [Zongyanglinia huanghaiensis]
MDDLVDFDQPVVPQFLFTDPSDVAVHGEELALRRGAEFAFVSADILPSDEWRCVSVQVQYRRGVKLWQFQFAYVTSI